MSEVQACMLILLFNVLLLVFNVGMVGIVVKLVTESFKEARHHKREMAEK